MAGIAHGGRDICIRYPNERNIECRIQGQTLCMFNICTCTDIQRYREKAFVYIVCVYRVVYIGGRTKIMSTNSERHVGQHTKYTVVSQ